MPAGFDFFIRSHLGYIEEIVTRKLERKINFLKNLRPIYQFSEIFFGGVKGGQHKKTFFRHNCMKGFYLKILFYLDFLHNPCRNCVGDSFFSVNFFFF